MTYIYRFVCSERYCQPNGAWQNPTHRSPPSVGTRKGEEPGVSTGEVQRHRESCRSNDKALIAGSDRRVHKQMGPSIP